MNESEMDQDPFGDLFELEDEFYSEGYEAGLADSAYAGMIEGKVFGIEKGYEKAMELGKLHGRTLVWRMRATIGSAPERPQDLRGAPNEESGSDSAQVAVLAKLELRLAKLPKNSRLDKHIESLLSLVSDDNLPKENSDQAVADFDDRLTRANAKAKVIANISAEPLNPLASMNAGIEDATGLTARH